MSCLARESRESKTFSSFLAMLTQSGLCVPRVRGFQRRLRGELRWLDNYRRWWRFNSRLGGLIPALCIEVQAILLKPPPGDSTGAIALLGSLRGSLRASTIRRQMTAVGASHLFPSVLAKVRKLNRERALSRGGGNWSSCPLKRRSGDATDRRHLLPANADFSKRQSLQASNGNLRRLLLRVGQRRWMFDEGR